MAEFLSCRRACANMRAELKTASRKLRLEGVRPAAAVLFLEGQTTQKHAYHRADELFSAVDIKLSSYALRGITELRRLICELNADRALHGIIVDIEGKCPELISPAKDVDAVFPTGQFVPCIVSGCARLCEAYGIDIKKNTLVLTDDRRLARGFCRAFSVRAAEALPRPELFRDCEVIIVAAGLEKMPHRDCFNENQTIIDLTASGELFSLAEPFVKAITIDFSDARGLYEHMLAFNVIQSALSS